MYTFRFDGMEFRTPGADIWAQANSVVRALGITDSFAWFDSPSEPLTFVLQHNVLMD